VATSPEATEIEGAPRYSVDELRDPTKLGEILKDYLPADIRAMDSAELEHKLQEALKDGLLRPKKVGGEARTVDDTFTDQPELEATIPDAGVQEVLRELKDRKFAVTLQDTEDALNDNFTKLTPGSDKVDAMKTWFEQAYLQGDVTLVVTKAAIPGKPAKGTAPATPGTPAEYAWRPKNRREEAIKLAFDQAATTNLAVGPEQDAYKEFPKEAGQHLGELDKQAREQQSKAKVLYEQHQKRMVEDARRRIEAADKQKEDQERGREQTARLGENRVEFKAGTLVENFDPKMQRDHYEKTSSGKRKLVRAQVDASGRLLRDQEGVDSQIHADALRENERLDLERQYGRDRATQIMTQRERESGMNLSRAQRALDAAHLGWQGREPALRTLAHDLWEQSEPKLSDFGSNGQRREVDPDVAREEAYAADREAQGQREVRERYQRMIDAEPDMTIKKQLREAQEAAVKAEVTRQETRTAEIGQIRAEAMNMAPDILTRAQDRVHWVGETLQGYSEDGTYDPRAMERASARLQALGIQEVRDPVTRRITQDGRPFVEMNHGRVREAYYRIPGNDNVIVFERYNRRNGELVSQTIMTTHDPIRLSRLGNFPIPPREVSKEVGEVRGRDEAIRKAQEGTGIRRALRATRDYAGIAAGTGFGTTTGVVEGDNGPYAQRGIDPIRRRAMRGREGRHGGFFYWFWNR
jgi:hypothetical protein